MFAGTAGASEDFDIDLADAPAVASADGSLAWVATGVQGALTWENYADDMASFDWTEEVTVEYDSRGDGEFGEIGTYTIYDVEDRDFGSFGRDEDEADASGHDGYITFHVPDPDGTGRTFSDGDIDSGTHDIGGPTWTIVQDEEFRGAEEQDDLDYDVPSAVDPGYGLPQEPIHAEDLEEGLPDEDGEDTVLRFTFTKTVTMYDADGDEQFTEVGDAQFEVPVENLEGSQEMTGTGSADAGSGEE